MSVREEIMSQHGERFNTELADYQNWLDDKTEECYKIATQARELGLDHRYDVEIPRAEDLADRTEKLLEEYLDGIKVAEQVALALTRSSHS